MLFFEESSGVRGLVLTFAGWQWEFFVLSGQILFSSSRVGVSRSFFLPSHSLYAGFQLFSRRLLCFSQLLYCFRYFFRVCLYLGEVRGIQGEHMMQQLLSSRSNLSVETYVLR